MITGGLGADTITGGLGADTFAFSTNGSVVGTHLDVITDYTTGKDKITFGTTVALAVNDATTAVATSNVTVTNGLIGFAVADSTYASKVAAIQTDTGLDTINQVAVFVDSANSYIYYSGAAIGNADDQIVKLTGITVTDLAVSNNVISAAVAGGEGDDIINCGSGDDLINGGSGDDFINGGSGNDTMNGGSGNDTIIAGSGSNLITGGLGRDRFYLDVFAVGADTITDFQTGIDTIVLGSPTFSFTALSIGIQIAHTGTSSIDIAAITTAANTDANVYYISNTASSALTFAQIEAAITAGSSATDQTTILIDNGTDTLIYFDVAAETDAGAGTGLILVGTLLGITGTTAFAGSDLVYSSLA